MILSQGITTTTKTLIMNKQSQYQKYRKTILVYGKTKVTCECGVTLNRNSLSKHRKTQKHKDKVGQGADPNSMRNVVFSCCGCGINIIRDSEAHDFCHTDDGDNWYCVDCKCDSGADPNSIQWFFEGYDSSEEEEEEIVLKKGDIDFSKKCDKICFCCGKDITSITKGVASTKRGWICEDC